MRTGVCLDVGSGAGRLGIELATLTSLKVYVLDINSQAITLASKNICARGISSRVSAVQGSVQKLPFANNSVNLIVSRGSIFFWKDKSQGVREIYRILKPGGIAFIGGGVSRYLSQKERRISTQWREGELAEEREKRENGMSYHLLIIFARFWEILIFSISKSFLICPGCGQRLRR